MAMNGRLATTTFAIALLWGAAALAQPAAPAPESSDLAPPEPTCTEWTNLCRICTLADDGTPACSNIAIACQPEPLRCTKHKEEKK
jgi:hypothetical protein